MKDGVVIVNTARGAVIDEAALVDALDCGKVASAGLDVFEEEPSVHPGLIRNLNVMLVPHMGTWTVEVSFCPMDLPPPFVQENVVKGLSCTQPIGRGWALYTRQKLTGGTRSTD